MIDNKKLIRMVIKNYVPKQKGIKSNKNYSNDKNSLLKETETKSKDINYIFIQKLIESIKEKKSVVCLGLDPRLGEEGQIPKFLLDENDNDPNKTIFEFNKNLIDFTHDLIPIIKPQMAFYEKYDALDALKKTIKYAHKFDLLVVIDSKRNDIKTTSEAYAHSTFENYKADACTINAYLGEDGITPFLEYEKKGVFILVKTSNPSSSDFQDLFSIKLENIKDEISEINISSKAFKEKNLILKRNYIHIAEFVRNFGKDLPKYSSYHNLGAVVGATYPLELKKIRKITKNSFIIMAGYGAQGGTANNIKYGFEKNGLGGIVNSSRDIMFAYNQYSYPPEKFGEAARMEVEKMREEINKVIGI